MEVDYRIVKSLERIADALENKTPLPAPGLKEISESMRKKDDEIQNLKIQLSKVDNAVTLSTGKTKLADAMAEAICNKFNDENPGALSHLERVSFHSTVLTYANRYFACAQDTEAKLSQAFEEMHRLRCEAHESRAATFAQIHKLLEHHFPADRISTNSEMAEGACNFINAFRALVTLNQPRSEEL